MNNLKPFFEDNYRRINVREYARLLKISPPFASKILKEMEKEGLLLREKDRLFLYFVANRQNSLFLQLQRIYYAQQIEKTGLFDYFEKELVNPLIILFGSLAKGEAQNTSDMDLAIFTTTKKELEMKRFEQKLGREIQLFTFKNRKEAEKNEELFNNICNGCILRGSW